MNIFKYWYDRAEKKVQSEIPWYATGNGKMCIDVEEWVKRDCFREQVEVFEQFRQDLEEMK